MKKSLIGGLLAATLTVQAWGQSGTNSPYSQYGLGVLSDQSQGFNRGMNGVGLGLREGNLVNTLNPASYSAVDSLTMIFDVGISGQITNFKEGGRSINAKNSNFEYAVGQFRLMKNLGVSFGVLPLSNIGYSYSSETRLNNEVGTISQSYSGSGGLRQVFVGAGYKVIKPLSIGFNFGYIWGDYKRSITSTGTENVNAITKVYEASVKSYNLNFGVQWEQQLNRLDKLTVGASVGLGHKLDADPTCTIMNYSTATYVSDTTVFTVKNGLELPLSYGFGATWSHRNQLLVGADVTIQKWGSTDYPSYNETTKQYELCSGLLKDRTHFALGADYVPNPMSRRFVSRIHYRAGLGYSTPYYIINGKDGPREFSLSAGFGIPLQNSWNNRSTLNISAQWVNTSASGMIKENTFRINLGLTFNERWFAKWRID